MVTRARKQSGRLTRGARMLAYYKDCDGPVRTALRNKFTRPQLSRWSRALKDPPLANQMHVIREITAQFGDQGPIEMTDWVTSSVVEWCEKKTNLLAEFPPTIRSVVNNHTPPKRADAAA